MLTRRLTFTKRVRILELPLVLTRRLERITVEPKGQQVV